MTRITRASISRLSSCLRCPREALAKGIHAARSFYSRDILLLLFSWRYLAGIVAYSRVAQDAPYRRLRCPAIKRSRAHRPLNSASVITPRDPMATFARSLVHSITSRRVPVVYTAMSLGASQLRKHRGDVVSHFSPPRRPALIRPEIPPRSRPGLPHLLRAREEKNGAQYISQLLPSGLTSLGSCVTDAGQLFLRGASPSVCKRRSKCLCFRRSRDIILIID